jgi:hypothetical protein
MRVVSFMSWPIHSRGKHPQFQLERRLYGLQSQSGFYEEEKNLLPLPGNAPWLSSLYPVTILATYLNNLVWWQAG